MKALVLSGGSGTRLRPLTLTRSKQLIPIANRPLLHHVLDNIASTGIQDVVIVTGNNGDEIRQSVGDGSSWKLNLTFAVQNEPRGLADAVKTAANQLGDEDFLMYLGDNILPDGISEYLKTFKASHPDALLLLHPVRNPEDFGIAVLDGERVIRLIEKPTVPVGNLGLVGVYFFTPIIHEAIQSIKPSFRNELEITDAIQYLLETGARVEARILKGVWHDAGKPGDLLEANYTFLQRLKTNNLAKAVDSTFIGLVDAGEGTTVSHSQIMGPVIIGENCSVRDSFIGPFTAIADGCQIESSGIEYSILLPNSRITDVPLVSRSILGAECHVKQSKKVPYGSNMVIGDYSSLAFPI
ncbi:MAG TPA: glucose-1-phosphate thymidylyltransferase [Bacillota bacterium]|nr:glucose-1-phosphate thymidylyltransferase [Bacillota bacterium]